MCGRFTLRTAPDEVLDHFEVLPGMSLAPRFNIAPTQAVAVVLAAGEAGDRRLSTMRWGLVPFWSDDATGGARLINARSETVATKPAFRAAYKKRRCLVPADGYYEWQKVGAKKVPWLIECQGAALFAFAGLWETWTPRDAHRKPIEGATPIETFTILTTEANTLTRPVHDRMPVILERSNYDLWLDPGVEGGDKLASLLHPYPSERMRLGRVSTHVNNPRHDDPQCVAIQRDLFGPDLNPTRQRGEATNLPSQPGRAVGPDESGPEWGGP